MSRKEFLDKSFYALFVIFALAFTACSNSEDEANPTPTALSKCLENGALGNIELNHGHALSIPKEDIAAAKEKTYSIQGTADHSHEITVTPQDFTALKNVNATRIVDTYSTTENDHRHSVLVFCAL